MAQWVIHLPRNIEDLGSSQGTGRYIIAQMTSLNGIPLSLGPIPSERLKKHTDVDKSSSFCLCLKVRGMLVTGELGLFLYSQDGSNSTLSHSVKEILH